ncbi:MAG: PqqD family protein [Kiritimatiellia bacterium]|jgi:hypothetical protein|nr:PqqD family protein [Kiritimatiellia bacterium]MDP6810904.1 PqqD family protein [Kiritimatiellia bacterium]MDP7023378.1 PqqD family protein [Kiritimatiellia bacterium]
MRLFGWSGKRRNVRPVIVDRFAVIPLLSETVELRRDSDGNAHLREAPNLNGLRKKVVELLGHDYSRKVQLDEYGTLFIDMVDGSNRLSDIVDRMVAEFGKERKDVEEGVVLFTKKLMTLNMLKLKVEGSEA